MNTIITLVQKHTRSVILIALVITVFFTYFAWHAMRTLEVCITMQTSQDMVMQLFYDRGRGLNTVDVITLPVRRSHEFSEYCFRLPKIPIHTLALAPLNRPGVVTIQAINLKNTQKKVIQQIPVQHELQFAAETREQTHEFIVNLPFSYPIIGDVSFFLLISQVLLVFVGSLVASEALLLLYGMLRHKHYLVTGLILLIGFGLRLYIGVRGHNFDFESWKIVAAIAAEGKNVYVETSRYNYGPVWFQILSLFHHIASLFLEYYDILFRYLIIGFLSLVDLGIFVVLYRQYHHIVAHLFFLNPISIIITGYHNQFDNLAMLAGMCAVVLIGNDWQARVNRRKMWGLLLLGLSLITKHILFLFPFWLMLKQQGKIQKLLVFTVPLAIFVIGFLPYWPLGKQGILQNVFYYASSRNEPFFLWFVPECIKLFLSSRMVWLLLLILGAFAAKKEHGFDALLLYSGILVMASPSLVNQYLAIVIPLVSRYYKNVLFILYTLFGFWHILIAHDGLHYHLFKTLIPLGRNERFAILIGLLGGGLLWHFSSNHLISLAKKIAFEMRIQLGYEN